jgi:hypothetical protein
MGENKLGGENEVSGENKLGGENEFLGENKLARAIEKRILRGKTNFAGKNEFLRGKIIICECLQARVPPIYYKYMIEWVLNGKC